MSKSKEQIISEITYLLKVLLEAGLDEDCHYHHFTNRTISGSDIQDLIKDIDAVDSVISNVRPIILDILNKVAQSYIKNDLDDGLTGNNSILKEEDDRILSEMQNIANQMPENDLFNLKIEEDHMRNLIAKGLNVEKELQNYRGQLLADQLAKEEAKIAQDVLFVKDKIREILQNNYLRDHSSNCSWWKDWHACDCGFFDQK